MKTVKAWAIVHEPSGELWPASYDQFAETFALFRTRSAVRKFKRGTWLSKIIRVEIRQLKPARKKK